MQQRKYHQRFGPGVRSTSRRFPGVPPTQPCRSSRRNRQDDDKYKTVASWARATGGADVSRSLSFRGIPPDITVDIKKIDLTPALLKFEGEWQRLRRR
jgi:hypothetical protein